MSHTRLLTYLGTTYTLGGVLGAAHGWAVSTLTHQNRHDRFATTVIHGAMGATMAAWAPVAIPLWAFHLSDVRCPYNPRVWRWPPNGPTDYDNAGLHF